MFEVFVNEKLESKIRARRYFDVILGDSNFKAVSFVNPFSYVILSENECLIDSLDLLFSDGALFCAFTNLRRKEKIDRVSFDFSSIAGVVFEYAVENDISVALVGAAKGEIDKAVDYLKLRYPRLNICFHRDGYFDESDFEKVVKEIDRVNAGFVVAGMGTPLQDQFITYIKENSSTVVQSFTCGGFLTQTALGGDYYSPYVKKTGLRWLQRCIKHVHVRKRVLKDYPIFILSYIFNIKFFK